MRRRSSKDDVKSRVFRALEVAVIGLVFAAPSTAQNSSAATPPRGRPELHAFRVTHPPVIDGALDDEAWTQPPMETTEWLSYNPLNGDRIPQQTHVWVAYDDNYFYFAFKCDDPEPARIKTSIARRDNVWNDDWVGLSLDALGTGQLSYHMMVNPSGVQMDMLNSVAAGEDQAPDWIWDSAGRLTETGYTVEIRLPLRSIRFTSGENVHMGILFWRRVSRIGVSVAWPPIDAGTWVFERHATLVVPELRPRPARDLIPTATFATNQERDTPSRWGGTDQTGGLGLSAKVGLGSTVTLDVTVNPDFSQVESDAFQVQVNQRFPVFFPEKRSFFMEGAGIFTLAGTQNGDQSLLSAVNTRNIVNPIAGAKITGNAGPVTFATLTAVDEEAGPSVGPADPGFGRNRTFNIGRVEYSLRPGSYVGAIVTDTEQPGAFNRVTGADVSLKLTSNQSLKILALQSISHRSRQDGSVSGFGSQARYSYNTRRWAVASHLEHFDTGFQMDTAFLNRVGDTNAWAYGEVNFYPDKVKWPWLRRIQPFTFNQATHDVIQRGDEFFTIEAVRLYFTRQGFLRLDRITGHEPFAGQRFKTNRWRVQSNAQLFRWLSVYANASSGLATFYDPVSPYQGRSNEVSSGFNFQPSGRLSESLDFQRVAFDRESTGERVYTIHILNSKTTYQFTNHFFLRAIAQFDSSRSQVLTDFLSSYELRPGTVFYAGYGSLIEQRDFRNDAWITGAGRYQTTRRGLFLKASYLYRF
jgi:Domain of unknown function (DUF5916)/Carbohydrate family 9 binding domain-like